MVFGDLNERFAEILPGQTITACLVYLPQHMFFWILLLSEIRYYWRHSYEERRKSTSDLFILSTKSILNTILIMFVLLNVGHPDTPVIVRIFKALSYVITLPLLHLGERYNVRDQTFLLSFWSLDVLINLIRIVEQLTLGNTLYTGTLLALALLTAYSIVTRKEEEADSKVEPNIIRSMCFTWFSEVSQKVHRSQLENLGDLDDDLKCQHLIKHFKGSMTRRGQYESVATKDMKMHPDITMWRLLQPFRRELIYTGIHRLILTVLFFTCPFLIRQILRNDVHATTTDSHFYVISFLIVSLMIAAFTGQYQYGTQKIGLKIKSILMTLIYEKSLKLKTRSGTDITLLTIDSSRFVDLMSNLHLVWSGLLIIIISIAGLLITLGIAALIGVIVMAGSIFFTKWITDKLQLLQNVLMNRKDSRISSTNEAVGMMKLIKFFCWEDFFQSRILHCRQKELKILKKIIYWNVPKYMLGVITPLLVSIASFGLMIQLGYSNRLTLEAVFVSIALFNILKYPLSVVPNLSTTWTATRVAVDRINQFLKTDEIQQLPNLTLPNQTTGRSRQISESFKEALMACQKEFKIPVISVKNLFFDQEGSRILENINLQILEESFVIITGPVGCGKSSLLAAILGEWDLTAGEVIIRGNVAFVSQEPWIQHRPIIVASLLGNAFKSECKAQASTTLS